MFRHIRKSKANVTDHRFRSVVAYTNKLAPTICGADPASSDLSKSDAVAIVAHSALRPDWLDGICPVCLAAIREMSSA